MTKKFNFELFLIGFILVWVSILAFKNPETDLIALTLIFSISAFVKGLLEISVYRKIKKSDEGFSRIDGLVGLIDILIAIFFLVNIFIGISILPFIFSVWFIADSVVNLLNIKKINIKNKFKLGLYVIANCICVFAGFVLLVNPIVAALTLAFIVGCNLLITGINYLILSF
ncbi:HdeD family acid-resistance protein [Vagococcus fluvialis]|uniref:Acid-resistance membrane protein n=1 Tax=Vagococcus fluvialis TaxID=2738 RepID=A0A7X6I3G0_9ENTE|nr:DUF308 domain-containing protein [Vagococcus fluvialis]NKC68543.1 hypothetical protein [Vagococcus fluvialis]